MSYITMEIWTGIWILVRLLPMALIIFSGVMIIEVGIEFIQKKKIEVKILNWLCQFLWILIVVAVPKRQKFSRIENLRPRDDPRSCEQ